MINIDKNRIAANITEYHIVSKLIFLHESFMIIRQLIHVKKYKNFKNQHVKDDLRTSWSQLLSFVHFTQVY